MFSLIESAKLCGADPFAYLKDVLARLPTLPPTRLDELLPWKWQLGAESGGLPVTSVKVRAACADDALVKIPYKIL